MKSRYCYCPMTSGRIGRRTTLIEKFRRWQIERQQRREQPDIFTITGYR